jgi:hypothetical protein
MPRTPISPVVGTNQVLTPYAFDLELTLPGGFMFHFDVSKAAPQNGRQVTCNVEGTTTDGVDFIGTASVSYTPTKP